MANAVHAYFFPKSCQAPALVEDNAGLYHSFLLNEKESFGDLVKAFRKHYGFGTTKNWEFKLNGGNQALKADDSVETIIERSIELASVFSHRASCGGDISYIIIYFGPRSARQHEFVAGLYDPNGATVLMY